MVAVMDSNKNCLETELYKKSWAKNVKKVYVLPNVFLELIFARKLEYKKLVYKTV